MTKPSEAMTSDPTPGETTLNQDTKTPEEAKTLNKPEEEGEEEDNKDFVPDLILEITPDNQTDITQKVVIPFLEGHSLHFRYEGNKGDPGPEHLRTITLSPKLKINHVRSLRHDPI